MYCCECIHAQLTACWPSACGQLSSRYRRCITMVECADALELRARAIVQRLEQRGIEASRLLMQLPGNWAGITAVKALEADGIQCQVTHVYSFAQAVAAIKAHASVLVVNITHVNVWYDKHPGALRDPKVRENQLPAVYSSAFAQIAHGAERTGSRCSSRARLQPIWCKLPVGALLASGCALALATMRTSTQSQPALHLPRTCAGPTTGRRRQR